MQYSGVLVEHRTVRTKAGMFDLSHMGELMVSSPDAMQALQAVTTNDLSTLERAGLQYSILCLPNGGIIDDILVYRLPEGYLLWSTPPPERYQMAARAAKRATLSWKTAAETALIAVQGPLAEEILQKLTSISGRTV